MAVKFWPMPARNADLFLLFACPAASIPAARYKILLASLVARL
jgi:hypothetical protein